VIYLFINWVVIDLVLLQLDDKLHASYQGYKRNPKKKEKKKKKEKGRTNTFLLADNDINPIHKM
jgi:exopolysaccharide biosynthesis protein